MRNIYCTGEAVYDIIFRNEKPVEARPGGALLNTAVSLGRLGMPVHFAGDMADDKIGRIITGFLRSNRVGCDWVNVYPGARSRLALAFLSETGDADYMFYKLAAAGPRKLVFPHTGSQDIVMFGSWFAINPDIRPAVSSFLNAARDAASLLVYDPNIRTAHLKMMNEVKPFIEENISLSHVVKGSDEDFRHYLGTDETEKIYEAIAPLKDKVLIITRNSKGASLAAGNLRLEAVAPGITPVSTVGAGDSFRACFCYCFMKFDMNPGNLFLKPPDVWQKMINTAVIFASSSCLGYDNYLSEEFARAVIRNEIAEH